MTAPPWRKSNTPSANAPASSSGSKLGSVTGGKILRPQFNIVYGPEGVGKTTLASTIPKAIWIDNELGSGNVDVTRYPLSDNSFTSICDAMRDIIANGAGAYEHIVIDSVSALEVAAAKHVMKANDWQSVEDPGYGKGYVKVAELLEELIAIIRTATSNGISVTMLAHAHVASFKNPSGEDYDTYTIRADKKFAAKLFQNSDNVGFMNFSDLTSKKKGELRAKAVATDGIKLHMNHSASFYAKNRLDIEDPIVVERNTTWPLVRKTP